MRFRELLETSTAGSTSSSSIANNSSSKPAKKDSIGIGFDPEADWGIYPKPKK